MTLTVKIEYNQLTSMIEQLNNNEKEKLSEYLDSLLLKDRLNKYIGTKKDIPISIEEINEEVEKVRLNSIIY